MWYNDKDETQKRNLLLHLIFTTYYVRHNVFYQILSAPTRVLF